MADAMLAGLPRIVRVDEEVRLRGWAALSVAAAAAVWWTLIWLLDEPVRPARTWLAAAILAVPVAVASTWASPHRVRGGTKDFMPPPRRVVYETRADGRQRRTRLSGVVFLTAVVLLVFDRLTDGGGVMAGLLIGLATPPGVVDLVEARTWATVERARESRLYALLRPRAMMARYGQFEVYEVPRDQDDPRRAEFELDIGRRG